MKRLILLLCLVSLCAYGQRKPISTGGSGNQITVTDDTSTNATMYPVWIPTGAGTRQMYITTSKITWNPSTGVFTVAGSIGTGTAPTACGSATGCFGATGAGTAGSQVAGQGYLRLNATEWVARQVNGAGEVSLVTAASNNAAGIVGLFSTCSGTQYLGADGACHTATSGSSVFTVSMKGATITTANSNQLFIANGWGGYSLGDTDSVFAQVVPVACSVAAAYAVTNSSNGTGDFVLTLRRGTTVSGMADTAVVITIGSGAAAGTFTAAGVPLALSAGDLIDWKGNMGGAAQTSAQLISVGIQCN